MFFCLFLLIRSFHFLHHVSDVQPLVSGASVRRTMAVLEAALRSAREDQPINVNVPPLL